MSNSRQPFGGILSGLFSPGKNRPMNVSVNTSRTGAGTGTGTAAANASASAPSPASQISIYAIISYIAVVGIIVLIFLIFIDRFITPVFKLKPGTPGYIPLPYGDDGVLYWTKTPRLLRDDSTIISNLSSGYTLSLDLFIHNPQAFAKSPRILFTRGFKGSATPTGPSNINMSEFNLQFSLARDTNDLAVATMLENNSTGTRPIENVSINNVPIRKGFRVTVVLYSKLMEVYLNGRLYQSRPLLSPPIPSFHFLNPPAPEGEATAAVRNLKIWKRCLTSSEVREMTPPIDDFSDYGNVQPGCGNVSEIATALINKL